MLYNGQMEQLTRPEDKEIFSSYFEKAQKFLAENSPEPENFDTYQSECISRLEQGERIWTVRNVEEPGRVYDLIDGARPATLATIEWNGGEFGFNTYSCTVYISSDVQEKFVQEMVRVYDWISSKHMSEHDTQTVFLGMALTEIEELTA
jgi:hypothetical protein